MGHLPRQWASTLGEKTLESNGDGMTYLKLHRPVIFWYLRARVMLHPRPRGRPGLLSHGIHAYERSCSHQDISSFQDTRLRHPLPHRDVGTLRLLRHDRGDRAIHDPE